MFYILRRTAVLKRNLQERIGSKYISLYVKFTDLLVRSHVLGGKLHFQVFRAANLGVAP